MAMTEDTTGPATWLTLTEAAERLGVRRELLRSRARRGLIPSQKSNRGEMLVQVQPGQGQAITVPATMPAARLIAGVTGPAARSMAMLEDELAEVKAELNASQVAQGRAEERAAA